MYYLRFGYEEARNLPIVYRRWFLQRTKKEMQESSGENEDLLTLAKGHDPAGPGGRRMF